MKPPVAIVLLGLGAMITVVVLVLNVGTPTVTGPDQRVKAPVTPPPTQETSGPTVRSGMPAGAASKDVVIEAPGLELVQMPLDLPNPVFDQTPKQVPEGANIDMKRHGKSRQKVFAPKGLVNVAEGKPVTGSDANPLIGELELVTDGDKQAYDGRLVELKPGKQWVQVDLGQEQTIWMIMLWHKYQDPRIYRDVVVQVANGPDFVEAVVVFNNDLDNSSGFGVGADYDYFESHEGELINAKGARGRYVRFWSNGSTADDQNHYTEAEVWALPAGG